MDFIGRILKKGVGSALTLDEPLILAQYCNYNPSQSEGGV